MISQKVHMSIDPVWQRTQTPVGTVSNSTDYPNDHTMEKMRDWNHLTIKVRNMVNLICEQVCHVSIYKT